MILSELRDFYEANVGDGNDNVTRRFWMIRRPNWELVLTENGEISAFYSLIGEGEKTGPKMSLPAGQRASEVKPYAYFDDYTYIFGNDPKRGERKRQAFKELHHDILDDVDDVGGKALLEFLDNHAHLDELECVTGLPHDSKIDKDLIVFRLEGDPVFLHERPALKTAWERFNERILIEEREASIDLVTGEVNQPRARLFPQVTGFPRAQSAGASLVGANAEAFRSYGQISGDIGAISQESADKAANALSYLSKSLHHRLRIGNDEILFWADTKNQQTNNAMMLFFNPIGISEDQLDEPLGEDKKVLARVREMLIDIRRGKRPIPYDPETPYHVVGITPNNARLSIRFYESGTMGELEERVRQFLLDTELEGVEPFSVGSCLRQTAPLGKWEELPHPLIVSAFNAYIKGRPFPAALFQQIILRTRVDHGARQTFDMGIRAATLKACLLRNARFSRDETKALIERSLTVALNENNTNIGYLLGRLFALLEKVQTEAGGKLNKTIRDSYMGAAATTPGRVFPRLLNMAQHHVAKAEYGGYIDDSIEQVMENLDDGFPPTLDYEDQGWFYIGYYQQRHDFYTSKKATQPQTDTEKTGA